MGRMNHLSLLTVVISYLMLLLLFLSLTWVVFRADSFDTAWAIIQSMMGFNGLDLEVRESPGRWFSVAAFLLAIIGPTSQAMVQKLRRPNAAIAVVTALFIFYLTLNVANYGYTEFLYFQF